MTIQSVDSTSVVPQVLSAQSLLAYVAGNSFLDFAEFEKARPDLVALGWIVSTTLTCVARARCYDIEPGGGQNKNIGIFMKNADRTHGLPWLYTFASNVAAMVSAAKSFGYTQGKDYYVYAAHPNTKFGQHICSPSVCGFPKSDGTQYLFAKSYDRGILNDYMLPAKHVTTPTLHGKLRVEVELDADKGTWTTKPLPGTGVQLGGHNRRWRCELSVGEEHGDWATKGLPFG